MRRRWLNWKRKQRHGMQPVLVDPRAARAAAMTALERRASGEGEPTAHR